MSVEWKAVYVEALMANSVYDSLRDIVLDLTRQDLGHPSVPELPEELRVERAEGRPGRYLCSSCYYGRPCNAEAESKSSIMYFQMRNGHPVAVHHNPGHREVTSNESDEHKALKERIYNDAREAGFQADVESRASDGRRRTDVLVRGLGKIKIGWEPQMSSLTVGNVRRRSKLAERDGVTPMWLTKNPKAQLINQAPWSRIKDTPWQLIPKDPLEIIGGVNTLESRRCDETSVLPCPDTNHGRCGKWHASWSPTRNLPITRLIELTATGEYQVLHLKRIPNQRGERYLWAARADIQRFRDLTGETDDEDKSSDSDAQADMDSHPAPGELETWCRYGQDTGFRAPPAEHRDCGEPITVGTLDRPALDRPAIPELLNWQNPKHWHPITAPCIDCGGLTNLRNDHLRPQHKVCAETQL